MAARTVVFQAIHCPLFFSRDVVASPKVAWEAAPVLALGSGGCPEWLRPQKGPGELVSGLRVPQALVYAGCGPAPLLNDPESPCFCLCPSFLSAGQSLALRAAPALGVESCYFESPLSLRG